MEDPIKMDDLGVPLFLETPICSEIVNHQVIQQFGASSAFETIFLLDLGMSKKTYKN